MICGTKDNLCVHHIKTRKTRPDLILDVSNGITLCRSHHGKTYFREKVFERFFQELLQNAANSVKVPSAIAKDNAELTMGSNLHECVSHRSRIFDNLYRPYKNKKLHVSTDWRKGKNHWHWNHEFKQKPCLWCKKITATPTVRTRVKKFCSNFCQQKWLWKNEYAKMCLSKTIKRNGWSRKFSECILCKKREYPHEAHGYCFKCFYKKTNKERYWLKKDSNAPTKTAPERDDICRTS